MGWPPTSPDLALVLNGTSISAERSDGVNPSFIVTAPKGKRIFVLGVEADYSPAVTGFKSLVLSPKNLTFRFDAALGVWRLPFPSPIKSGYGEDALNFVGLNLDHGGVGPVAKVTMFYAIR